MSEKFYKRADKMFAEKLSYEPKSVIRVRNVKDNKVLGPLDINYSKLMFDANLNMYKLGTDGEWTMVNNENFKPIVVEEKI